MKIDVITIFTDFFNCLDISLIGKAQKNSIIDISIHNLRDFTNDKHKTVDDKPFGGGAGMLMKANVWGRAIDSVIKDYEKDILIILTPSGIKFSQQKALELAKFEHIILCCGRYEGFDARIFEYYSKKMNTIELSIGDYVINGGEVAALVVIEAVSRLLPNVISNSESLLNESHNTEGVVEYPQYTRPMQWNGLSVPDVLLSGNHAKIEEFRNNSFKKQC